MCRRRARRFRLWKVWPATISTRIVETIPETEDGPEVFEDHPVGVHQPHPVGHEKERHGPNRNRAAGRTVSARTQRRHNAAKSRIMPMMLPDT